jgi:hypothetical protein
MELVHFPKELIFYILTFCDHKTLCKLEQVDTHFKDLAIDQQLWLSLYKRRWHKKSYTKQLRNKTWKDEYGMRVTIEHTHFSENKIYSSVADIKHTPEDITDMLEKGNKLFDEALKYTYHTAYKIKLWAVSCNMYEEAWLLYNLLLDQLPPQCHLPRQHSSSGSSSDDDLHHHFHRNNSDIVITSNLSPEEKLLQLVHKRAENILLKWGYALHQILKHAYFLCTVCSAKPPKDSELEELDKILIYEPDDIVNLALEKFQLASEKFKTKSAIVSQGRLLFDLAKIKSGDQSDKLKIEANEKYLEAQKNCGCGRVLYDWGNCYKSLGLAVLEKTSSDDVNDEVISILKEACVKYSESADRNLLDANIEWSRTMCKIAELNTKKGVDSAELFSSASSRLRQLMQLRPALPSKKKAEIYREWAKIDLVQAKNLYEKFPETAQPFFVSSIDLFKLSMQFDPFSENTKNLCGTACVRLARLLIEDGKNSDKTKLIFGLFTYRMNKKKVQMCMQRAQMLLNEAKGYFESLKAESRKKIKYYNLACVSATEGDERKCREYLELCREANGLKLEDLVKDKDFDLVRNCDWFQEILTSIITV